MIPVEELVFVDPNIAFSVDFSERVEIQLKIQKSEKMRKLKGNSLQCRHRFKVLPVSPEIESDCVESIAAKFPIPIGSSLNQ